MACIAMYCIDFKMNLKSLGFWLCGFKSRSGYHGKDKNNQSNKQCRETTYGWFFCAFSLYADRERELSSAIHSKKHR